MKGRAGGASIAARLVLLFIVGSALIFAGAGYALYHALAMRIEANDLAEVSGKTRAAERLLAEIDSLAALEEGVGRFRDLAVGHPGLTIAVSASGQWLLSLPAGFGTIPERSWLVRELQRELPGSPVVTVEVVLAIETTDNRELLREHAAVAALVALLGTAASALLAWFVAQRGLAPLAQVAARAEQVTARRLGERLDLEDAPREVHGLADSINRMLERLEDSFHALEQFSADIAHELRTPLNNLLLQTQVTLGRPRSAEEYREALHSNLEELERLQRMVADMLFLARADRGMIELRREDIDLRIEIQGVAEYFEAAAAERALSIGVRGEGRLHADRSLLRRAVNNLLSNAVRYSPGGGAIEVDVGLHAGEATITVSNPAHPIPDEELRRLFKRFSRREGSRHREAEGAGLGLAIVDSIMKLQGGRFEARSADGRVVFGLVFPADALPDRNPRVTSDEGTPSVESDYSPEDR